MTEQTMTGVTELGYTRFGVKDQTEWQDFARAIVGLEVVAEGDVTYLRTDYWHHRIMLETDSSDDLLGAGLRVAGADEFAELRQHLGREGVKVEEGSVEQAEARNVLEVMFLKDPAGNPLEIFHGPQIDTYRPFYPGRAMHGRFMTDEGGLGHMILKNNGIDKAYRFYRLLGMRGGVEYRRRDQKGELSEILFMHCNSRDHTVAFGPPGRKSINHLMLEVDNLDDVFMTYDLVKASKYPVTIDLGRHSNDHMFSFYFATPSGWMIEIGWGGRPATHQSEYYLRDTYGHAFTKNVGEKMEIEPEAAG